MKMASIAVNSSIAPLPELDYFRLQHTQGSVERVYFVDKYTSSTDTNSSILEFVIPKSGQDFVDLQRTHLQVKVKLLKAGTGKPGDTVPKVPPALADEVGPINLLLQSMFSQIDITMNNTNVSAASSNYAYRAYIPVTLCYEKNLKNTWLTSQLYAKDQGDMDSTTPSSALNKGLQNRSSFTEGGATLELKGPLYSDIWQSMRWILPGIDIRIAARRNIDKFILMANKPEKKYELYVMEAKLNICYCSLFTPAYNALEAALSVSPAKYPLTRAIVKNYSISQSEQSKVFEDIFSGKIPSKVVIGFVSDEAYNGSFKANPFNFQHFNISFLSVYCNGVAVPHNGYELEWNTIFKKNTVYVDAFTNLFDFDTTPESIDITREDFCNGYALFVFSIEQAAKSTMLPLYKTGNLRIELKFKTQLPKGIQMIVYGQFPYILTIDKNRQIILE